MPDLPDPAERVRVALAQLAARAGCDPADGSPGAGAKVLAVVRAERDRLRPDPDRHPDIWNWWLARAAEVDGEPGDLSRPRLIVAESRALVLPAVALRPLSAGGRPFEAVELPACVAAAVKLGQKPPPPPPAPPLRPPVGVLPVEAAPAEVSVGRPRSVAHRPRKPHGVPRSGRWAELAARLREAGGAWLEVARGPAAAARSKSLASGARVMLLRCGCEVRQETAGGWLVVYARANQEAA